MCFAVMLSLDFGSGTGIVRPERTGTVVEVVGVLPTTPVGVGVGEPPEVQS